MPTGIDERVPWDEGAALEELERLQQGIYQWRERRKEVQTEFDRFVRGFRTPTRDVETRAALVYETVPMPEAPPSPLPATDDLPVPEEPIQLTTTAAKPTQPRRRTPALWLGAALALALVSAVFLSRSGPNVGTPPRPTVASTAVLPAPRTSPASPGITTLAPRPVEAGKAATSELTALRGVWVRVVVDGAKQVERELRTGERVPLAAGRTSVIRAGDGGSLRLTIDGQDRGTLGPEGEVITRTIRTTPAVDR